MREKVPLGVKIAHLAARQNGHVARRQLLTLGLSPSAITKRVRAGTLFVVYAGVYAVGHRQTHPRALAAAAVLACGPGAALSHDSAAALWGLRRWPDRPEVIAAGYRRRAGIDAHRSITLTRAEITIRSGIRVTTAARTIADISPRLTDAQLIRIVNDARHSAQVTDPELARLVRACPRAARLIDPGRPPTRSEFEDRFVSFLARHRLPVPLVNAAFHGFEVDALYESERLIVELDGYEFHRDLDRFEEDRRRDAIALAHGYRSLRITWRRLTKEPRQLAAQLRAILNAR